MLSGFLQPKGYADARFGVLIASPTGTVVVSTGWRQGPRSPMKDRVDPEMTTESAAESGITLCRGTDK